MAGCATSTVNRAVEEGATPLTVEEIYSLVDNNTLHLVSSDFDAHVFCAQTGELAASSLANTRDIGQWDIKSDSSLCLKFRVWYYGDVNCYSVYQEAKRNDYLLFSKNGALVYTATVATGNTEQLTTKSEHPHNTKFMRSKLSKSGNSSSPPSTAPASQIVTAAAPAIAHTPVAASSEEINHSVKEMARDCPACNLKDADLRQANLVGANLKGANLKGADLSRANLRRANLEGANLSGATLLSANLPGANLKDADLSGTDLTGSNLIQADFTGADLTNSILTNTLQEGSKGL